MYDLVLLTVHPTDCSVRDFFAQRLKNQTSGFEGRSTARMPTGPADLMLRMVNYMVDSFLELRRQLGKRLDEQQHLFSAEGPGGSWHRLLDSRNALHRPEASSETAVQMHFSEQSNRTNNIMRVLTVLTAIFLPLNIVTGFFGMNFEGLPLIHSAKGFWIIFSMMLALGVGMSIFFWRRRYLR